MLVVSQRRWFLIGVTDISVVVKIENNNFLELINEEGMIFRNLKHYRASPGRHPVTEVIPSQSQMEVASFDSFQPGHQVMRIPAIKVP